MKGLASLALFQAFWLACVAGAGAGHGWIGPAGALVLVLAHVRWLGADRREVALWLGVAALGTGVDALLGALGAFGWAERGRLAPHPLPPLWIASLWVAFAALLRRSLAWLAPRPLLAALLGAAGGPLSWRAGAALGAVTVAPDARVTWLALALEWGALTPLLVRLANRPERRAAPRRGSAAPVAVALLALSAPAARAEPVEGGAIEPARVTWAELLARGVDPGRALPESLGPDDLAREVEELLALAFPPRVARGGDLLASARTAGDLLDVCVRLRRDPDRLAELFARADRAPWPLWERTGPLVRALASDAGLFADGWDPERARGDDGLRFGEPLEVSDLGGAPWAELDGRLQQAAALIVADLDTIKLAENDYAAYPARVGASYRAIDVVPDTYAVGDDGPRGPFCALRSAFECDLPFPFTSYACDMQVLNRLDGEGRLVCDIWSQSEDFLWFAGRDVLLPVTTSDGAWVGTLVVRQLGFDLRGVPDGDRHRVESLRMNLGNLKRDAERRFAGGSVDPARELGRVPVVAVVRNAP